MLSQEEIKKLLGHFLQVASKYGERRKNILLHTSVNYSQKVYEAFFNLVNSTPSPEKIVLILNTHISELNGFSTNRPIQSLIAHACLEGLAFRKPIVPRLTGTWEKLIWIIVNYSSYTSHQQRNVSQSFKKTQKETVAWITKMVTQNLCPNPCLRLELFRFIRRFDCDHIKIDQNTLSDNLIITLLEISDKYASLTLKDLPNFCPRDLQHLVMDTKLSMEDLIKDGDLYIKRTKVIAALLKLTRLLALVEKEKQMLDPTLLYVDLSNQISACLNFCGLMPPIPFIIQKDLGEKDPVLCFILDISNDPILMINLVDTLDTISEVSLYENDDEGETAEIIKKILRGVFQIYNKRMPKYKFHQEIYGCISPAQNILLRFIEDKMDNDFIISDQDSEADEDELQRDRAFKEMLREIYQMDNSSSSSRGFASDESDEGSFVDEDISDHEDISNEEDTFDEEDFSDEEDISDE